MTIFRRLVLTLLICLILFGVAVFAILAWQRENELRDAEAQTATREMSRLLSIILYQQDNLMDRVRDYATWDLAYDFAAAGVRDDNWDEISINTFQSAHVDFIQIVSTDGAPLLSQSYDNNSNSPAKPPDGLIPLLRAAGWIAADAGSTAQPMCSSGFVDLEIDLARIASCPILHTDRSGPVAGYIVFGSYLDDDDLSSLSELFGADIQLHALDRTSQTPSFVAGLAELRAGRTLSIQFEGDAMAVFTMLPGLEGDPIGVLELRQVRRLDEVFGGAIVSIGWIVLGSAAMAGLIMIGLMYQILFRRLKHLSDQVQVAAAQGVLAVPLPVKGRNELSALAGAVNRLLEGFQLTYRDWQQTRVAMLELAAFPEQNPTPVLRIGADGNVVYSNPAGTALLRAMAEQAEDPEELLVAWEADVATALAEGTTLSREYHATGRVLECNFAPFQSAGYVNVYTTDVTDRRRAESELRDERDFAHHVMNTMGQGLTITDDSNRYTYVNPAFARIVGREAEELIGLSPTDLIAAEDHPLLAQQRTRRLRGEVSTSEVRHVRPDSTLVHTLLTSAPRWRDGAVAGSISVITDLTERKLVEDRMRTLNADLEVRVHERTVELATANLALVEERALLAQRVEERTADLSAANLALARAARLKDEFLANMSHELRTPLNTVLGMAESIAEGIFGPVTEDQGSALGNIAESGRHLLALINDILDLSKIEAGRFQIHTDTVDPIAICQASLRMIRQAAARKDLRLEVSLPDDVGAIRADPRRLKQMLVNLLSNAVKFTPDGGAVGLKLEPDPASEQMRFVVWDTGIGIAPEDLARLFQPFTQLDSKLSRQYEGTGLGLSLVSRMAELHGGGVTVFSQPGQGSRFTIGLPWRPDLDFDDGDDPAPYMEQTVPVALPPRSPNTLLLIVDDNEQNIELLATYFTARGYRVVSARNGREALERADGGRPDLVLMDVQMPELDGLEATRAWRAIERERGLPRTPIVALTALALAGDAERCLEAGMDRYVTKPVALRELEAEVSNLLQAHAPAMEAN